MAYDNFKVLEIADGIEYIFNCNMFRNEFRRVSRFAKKSGRVKSTEEFREDFAEKVMISTSAIKQWESGRNGVSDLERVKEIARYLLLEDYHKLLMPKSTEEKKENSVMMNRMIDEKEREVARNLFMALANYICIFEESGGFEYFEFNFLCKDEYKLTDFQQHLKVQIKQARFDLPKQTCERLIALFYEIGATDHVLETVFETKEYKTFLKEEGWGKDCSEAKGLYLDRKADEYYDSLCEIMEEYLK